MSNINYYDKIGHALKDLRLKKNLSRKQLAEGICSVSYITRIENGSRCPTSVILRQLATKLGVTTEELFRAIESPSAIRVKELIDQLFYTIERSNYADILKAIDENENEIQISSIHDFQIVNALKVNASAMLEQKYSDGINKLQEILELTYIRETKPTDIEFGIMTSISYLMHLNGQKADAYLTLIKLKDYVDSINFIHTQFLRPRYYLYLTLISIDFIPIEDSFRQIERAISYCKEKNSYPLLRELYAAKGELFLRSGDQQNYDLWISKALTLHELIKCSDDDYFPTFLDYRKKLILQD